MKSEFQQRETKFLKEPIRAGSTITNMKKTADQKMKNG